MRSRQKRKLEEALPETFLLLSHAMKSGMSLVPALTMASEEGPEPLRPVLCRVLERVRLGRSLEESLLLSEKEIDLPDFSLMVHSILMLRQIGGNLAAHFENIAGVLRERGRLFEKIDLLTTQGRTQGILIGALPPAMLGLLGLLAPDFVSILFTTPLGWVFIVAIVLLDLGGFLWMQKWARVEV